MKEDLMKEAQAKAIIAEYEAYKSSLKDYVRALFKDTGLLQLEFDVNYFAQCLPFPPSMTYCIVREMLYVMPGVTRSSYSHRVRFPMYITEEDRDLGAKEEVGTLYWTKYGKQCRPFVFDAKYFLSPDEYIEVKVRNLVNFSTKGITYNDVRNCLRILQEEIPATDEVCSEYTLNVAPTTEAQKGREAIPDFFVMNVKVKKMSINLRVEGFALVSDKEV